jgi:spore photoproduct lyase
MKIYSSNRSTDFISPSIVVGCLADCSYCYLKRHHPHKSIDVATNINEILTTVNSHSYFADVVKPNQTDPDYITYDIGCNQDVALDCKFWDWEYVFNFFKQHEKAKASFATKFYNPNLLRFNPERKVRIRFSMMPEKYSRVLEPNTSHIAERIAAIQEFHEAGYDVHINFSPIIVHDDWLEEYKRLFIRIDSFLPDSIKESVKAECIFLTHNEQMHYDNLQKQKEDSENLLWRPSIQEFKTSQLGGKNIRYKYQHKEDFIQAFIDLHDEIMPWNEVRYIF